MSQRLVRQQPIGRLRGASPRRVGNASSLGAQTDRPTRHTALQVRSRVCAIRQLELIRETQHRLDVSLWT